MKLPTEQDPIWRELISNADQYQFEFLGTKILLGRLRLRYRQHQTPHETAHCIQELRAFFEKNSHLPKVKTDLSKFIATGAIQ